MPQTRQTARDQAAANLKARQQAAANARAAKQSQQAQAKLNAAAGRSPRGCRWRSQRW